MKVTTTRQANLNYRKRTGTARIPFYNSAENLKKITADFGILQHEKLNKLHGKSFHNLCDNALALISAAKQFQVTADPTHLKFINRYLDFMASSQHADGTFRNKRNENAANPKQTSEEAHAYTIWALGYVIAMQPVLPAEIISSAETMMQKALIGMETIDCPRAVALIIKGLYFYNTNANSIAISSLIKLLADRLAQLYLAVSSKEWQWFDRNIALRSEEHTSELQSRENLVCRLL